MKIQLAHLVLAGISLSLSSCFYIPGGKDVDNANAVGKYISDKYGRFDDRIAVEKMHLGKIYYVKPGRHPTVVLYDIVDRSDIASIEVIAVEALKVIGIERIDLVFYEKQNLSCTPTGACSREAEHVVHKVSVGN